MRTLYRLLTAFAGTILVSLALSGPCFSADSFDPCSLLSSEELQGFSGESVRGPERKDTKNPLGQKMCLFTTGTTSRLVQISVMRTGDMVPAIRKQGQSAQSVFMTTRDIVKPKENLTTLGDDAFWGAPGLHILKGDKYLVITVGASNKRENSELALRIAETVLARLGN